MARIKIDLPQTFSFTTEIPVRITDVNYGGHVGNDSILSILHEARVQYLNSLGMGEKKVSENTGLIMSGVAIEFKREAFYGDKLKVSVAATEFERVSFELLYKIEAIKNSGTQHIASAQSTMVCFNYDTRKIASVPEDVKVKLSN